NRFGFPDASLARRAREKAPEGFLCLQMIGSGSEGLSEFERALLRREELTESSFSVKSLPELGSRGGFRAAFAPLKGFKFSQKGGEATFRFSLPPGSYATSALREFLDGKKD
ncbi:MAG: tRNA pseudouridine(13) synthase TruD, partial [Candidatus ainarchaeum sp.]|nr:tRNA pseudouridine(13) synthase TruD [Candidatus ainarchaeum sp.]